MPYLATTLRPQGTLLSGYSLLDTAALPNSIAAVSGQPPTAETKAGCPDYGKCVYSVETLTLADQLGIAKFTWRAYMESMVNPKRPSPTTASIRSRALRRHPRSAATRLSSTRSSTSTRCSTSAIARPTTSRSPN